MLPLIPFMIVPLVLYIGIVVIGHASLEAVLLSIGLPSLTTMKLTLGDLLLLVGMIALFVEMVMATNTRTSSLINHGLSMLLFVVSGLFFLFLERCGTSTFLLLIVMMLIDVVAGYSIGIVTARRDLSVEKVQ